MKNIVITIIVVVLILAVILGWGGLMTKVSASREVVRSQIAKATPDDVILNEVEIELRKATERNADAQVEYADLKHEADRKQRIINSIEDRLAEHQRVLAKEGTMLQTGNNQFEIKGRQVSRERLEADVFGRLKVCKELGQQLEAERREYAAYQQSLQVYRKQIDDSLAEYHAKTGELQRMKVELRTARTIEALSSRVSNLGNLHENSNLARLTTEVRKRISRSRALAEWQTPTASAGLLDLSEDTGESATEAIDEYFGATDQVDISGPSATRAVQSGQLLDVVD